MFLWHPDAHTCPPGSPLCPGAAFFLRMKNMKDRKLDRVKRKTYGHVSRRDTPSHVEVA